jgi:hypothetical protein
MADNRMGGTALIAASVANIIVMALHPTGHQLFDAGERFNLIARLAVGVHWVALLAMTISFLGALALTQYLNAPNRLSIAAQVMYGFAVMAGMLAVVFSGFMGVGLARKIVAAAPPGKEYWEMMAGYNFGLNQVFARVLGVMSALAIMLWSAAILKTGTMSRAIAIYGLLVGAAIVIMVGPGFLVLDVHGFGLVVLVQSVWFITVGVMLRSAQIRQEV